MKFGEELLNGSVCDFGEKACEGNEVNSCLVERVWEVGRIGVGDKARLVCKGKGVHVSVRETMEGGVVYPGVGGAGNRVLKGGGEAGRRASWGLKGGIGRGG